jgi:DNA-binding CsgD family transcriptional regulator
VASSKCAALRAAIQGSRCSATETFQIAIETLELLGGAANGAPLLVVVDDAHWLDPMTADVLGFVGRRLDREPVALVVAARNGYATTLDQYGFPELHIEPLDDRSSGVLLDSSAPGVAPNIRSQVMAAAAGNPLALIELPKAITARPPGLPTMLERPPLTGRLQQAFAERFLLLPAAAQAILLVAAVDEEATLNEVLAAVEFVEDQPPTLGDLEAAIVSELVVHDQTRLHFSHPLLPSAICSSVGAAKCVRAHAALAGTVTDDEDRLTLHRAASAAAPDEGLAAQAHRASRAAAQRGSCSVALAAMYRAAQLTPGAQHRRVRLLESAELALEQGQLAQAGLIVREINLEGCGRIDRTRVTLIRAMIRGEVVADSRFLEPLIGAATEAAIAGQTDVALRLLEVVAVQAAWQSPRSGVGDAVVALARSLPMPELDLRVLSVLGLCDPFGTAASLHKVAGEIAPDDCSPRVSCLLGIALHTTGLFELSTVFLDSAIAGLREQGLLFLIPQALARQAWNAAFASRWTTAIAEAEEAAVLARDTHQPLWEAAALAAQSLVCAVRGENDRAEFLSSEAERLALPRGASAVLSDIQLVRAFVAIGGCRYEEAFQQLHRTVDPDDPSHHMRSMWRIGEYVEAAVHAGRTDEARQQIATTENLEGRHDSQRIRIGLLYGRALLADDDSAEEAFEVALRADLSSCPLYRARLLLEYGTWLRRRRRTVEGRTPLRAALEAFVALGTQPWAERARQELRASRESTKNEPRAWMTLTEQEQQVAVLAADGLSNREIGQRLYISHRTVSSHLYHVFPKLGVTSRGHLRAALGSSAASGEAS